MQAFFLYKTEKLSSGFSKTQMPKILKNSVFAQKLSSKPLKNRVFLNIFFPKKCLKKEIFSEFSSKNLQILGKLSSKIAKTQFSRNCGNMNGVKCVQKKPAITLRKKAAKFKRSFECDPPSEQIQLNYFVLIW